jgi:membrane protein
MPLCLWCAMLLKGMPVRQLLRLTYREFNHDDVLTYAAALAFHVLLALFPFLLFLLSLVTFLHIPEVFTKLMQWTQLLFPTQAAQQIGTVIQEFQGSKQGRLLSLGIVGAVWAASGGVRAAIGALNIAYDVVERRPAWWRYLMSILFTLGGALAILLAMALMLIGPRAGEWLSTRIGMATWFSAVWTWLRFPFAAGILLLFAAVVYSTLPNLRGFRIITIGSVFSVLFWILLSLGFRLYLAHFGRYNALYGSVGAIIVLLLYFWGCSIVLLIGGEMNAVVDDAVSRDEGGAGVAERGEFPDAV